MLPNEDKIRALLRQKRTLQETYTLGQLLLETFEGVTQREVAEYLGYSGPLISKLTLVGAYYLRAEVEELSKLGSDGNGRRLTYVDLALVATQPHSLRQPLLQQASGDRLSPQEIEKMLQLQRGKRRCEGAGRPSKLVQSQGFIADMASIKQPLTLTVRRISALLTVQNLAAYAAEYNSASEEQQELMAEEAAKVYDLLRAVRESTDLDYNAGLGWLRHLLT